MLLRDSLFTVTRMYRDSNKYIAVLKLDASHPVFRGHFPGHPVTPGAIQLQIVAELLEMHLQKKVRLKTMAYCKFLNILDPVQSPELEVRLELEEEGMDVRLRGMGSAGVNIFKLLATYTVASASASGG